MIRWHHETVYLWGGGGRILVQMPEIHIWVPDLKAVDVFAACFLRHGVSNAGVISRLINISCLRDSP